MCQHKVNKFPYFLFHIPSLVYWIVYCDTFTPLQTQHTAYIQYRVHGSSSVHDTFFIQELLQTFTISIAIAFAHVGMQMQFFYLQSVGYGWISMDSENRRVIQFSDSFSRANTATKRNERKKLLKKEAFNHQPPDANYAISVWYEYMWLVETTK